MVALAAHEGVGLRQGEVEARKGVLARLGALQGAVLGMCVQTIC